jgi:hypothetical protein
MNYAMTLSDTQMLPKNLEAEEIFKWGHELGKCPFYQKLGPGGVIAVVLTARELGLPPMACLNGGLHNIEGKVSISAQMMNAMIIRSGHSAKLIELTQQRCVIRFKRREDKEHIDYAYTVEEAQKAGYLGKKNWQTHLRDMLFCRCLSGGARKFMPDVIGNVYIHGELGDETMPVVPQEVQDHPEIIQAASQQLSNHKIEPFQQSEEPKKIEHVKVEGYEVFCEKHFREDDKVAYVRKIAQATNKTETQIINSAVANESGFLTAFEKWKADQKKSEKKGKNKTANDATGIAPLAPHSDEVSGSMDELI